MGRNRDIGGPYEIVQLAAALAGSAVTTQHDKDEYFLTSGPGAGALWTVTLDPNAVVGDIVRIKDASDNSNTRNIVVQVGAGSGQNMRVGGALVTTFTVTVNSSLLKLTFNGTTWYGEQESGI